MIVDRRPDPTIGSIERWSAAGVAAVWWVLFLILVRVLVHYHQTGWFFGN